MMRRIKAIYENETGVFRPVEPLELADGTSADVMIQEPVSPKASGSNDKRTPAEIVAEIAAMPMEPVPKFSGVAHVKVLYGGPNGTR